VGTRCTYANVYAGLTAAAAQVMSAFLNTGDHVVITDCSYGGTNRAARLLFAEKYKVNERAACVCVRARLQFFCRREREINGVVVAAQRPPGARLFGPFVFASDCSNTFTTPPPQCKHR
jgi:histidinol-phosphate/aromatic aminotransferase/cobyric acid decarboxylase-like protein